MRSWPPAKDTQRRTRRISDDDELAATAAATATADQSARPES